MYPYFKHILESVHSMKFLTSQNTLTSFPQLSEIISPGKYNSFINRSKYEIRLRRSKKQQNSLIKVISNNEILNNYFSNENELFSIPLRCYLDNTLSIYD